MNTEFDIFSVRPVVFEQGERDPFGFDDFAENLGAEYLPFSGSVSKPAYILFVAYVNRLLKEKRIKWRNEKEKSEIKIRLEKLLVYCWKENSKENLRGSAIIGNSFKIEDIDPFSGKGWIKQNCFKIYTETENNFNPQGTLKYYWDNIGESQILLLNDFINTQQPRTKEDKKSFEKLRTKLKKPVLSLYSNHLLEDKIKRRFKKELESEIKSKNKAEYFNYLESFFVNNKFIEEKFFNKTLDNDNLPFKALNNWFGKFVYAVDADINNKDAKNLWGIADNFFNIIPENIRSKYHLQKRPKPRIWFEYTNGKYARSEKLKKNISLWEAYMNRQGDEKGYFFNYRHYAFSRLLNELVIK